MSNTQNPYPPQTARWWFAEYLPEPYRGQAIANYDEKYLIDTNATIAIVSLMRLIALYKYIR